MGESDPQLLRQFFVKLSQNKELWDIQSTFKVENLSIIFCFWLFGHFKEYLERIYTHHKFIVSQKDNQTYLETLKSAELNPHSKDYNFTRQLKILASNLDCFDGSRSSETICTKLNVDSKVYDFFVSKLEMRLSSHTNKYKLFF